MPGRLWELGSLPETRPQGRRGCLLPWVLRSLLFPSPWPAARPSHPCCGSQAPSVGPEAENPFSIPGEKRCPHMQLGEQLPLSCLQVVSKITRSHQTALEVGKGTRRVVSGFSLQEKEGVVVRAQDRELGHPGWHLCQQTGQPSRHGGNSRLCEPDPA